MAMPVAENSTSHFLARRNGEASLLKIACCSGLGHYTDYIGVKPHNHSAACGRKNPRRVTAWPFNKKREKYENYIC
jgi:hypothetical protein